LALGAVGWIVLAVAIVDPRREFLGQDDGWAYARSVQHMLATGRYQLDQWSAANMPAQILLGAGLAKLFGYSLTLLRLQTLMLLAVALVSFWGLLRELGSSRRDSTVLTLGLAASPLVFMLSLTFMSDIQFVGWLLLALWLYVRGLRTGQLGVMLLASVAAAAAIGTRQFGVVVLGGLALTVVVARPRPQLSNVLMGSILPAAALVWQLQQALATPNFTQAYRLAEQAVFMRQPVSLLAIELAWRLSISVQYLALFLLPVAPLLIGIALRSMPSTRRRTGVAVTLTAAITALIMIGLSLDSTLTVRPPRTGGHGWPALGLIWVLPTVLWDQPRLVQIAIDRLAVVNMVPLIWLAVTAFQTLPAIRRARPGAILLGSSGLALYALQLAYVQFNDTYFVSLLPFALLFVAWRLRETGVSRPWLVSGVVLMLVTLVAMAVWMRGDYDRQQRAWQAADRIAAAGLAPARIAAPRHWAEYHGAFDDWIAAGAPGLADPPRTLTPPQDPFHDPFYAWLGARDAAASKSVAPL